jgi:citrate synthase
VLIDSQLDVSEQLFELTIGRPRQIYTGETARDYVNIANR